METCLSWVYYTDSSQYIQNWQEGTTHYKVHTVQKEFYEQALEQSASENEAEVVILGNLQYYY